MALKDFDAKDFFLKNGHYIALGIGLAVMIPLIASGFLMVLSSGRASQNANALRTLASSKEQLIRSATPEEGLDAPPKAFFAELKFDRVNPDEFETKYPWFVPGSVEDTKRRNPDVLLATDVQTTLVRAGVQGYILINNGNKQQIMVIQDAKPVKYGPKSPIYKRLVRLYKQAGLSATQASQAAAAGMRGPAGGGGVGAALPARGPMGGRGDDTGGGMEGMGSAFAGAAQASMGIVQLKPVDIDKAEGKKLAEYVYPERMLVVSAAFPFKKQLEEFRSKLRRRDLDELFQLLDSGDANWAFKGFEIQRRVFGPDGKPRGDWEKDYQDTLVKTYKPLMQLAVDAEPEDDNMLRFPFMINPGLVFARPKLARDEHYPPTEVPSLTKSMSDLVKMSTVPQVKRPPTQLEQKIKGQDLDFMNPLTPFGNEPEPGADPNKPDQQQVAKTIGASKDATDKTKDAKGPSEEPSVTYLIPEYALVRFVDINIQPGFSYQYRFKVKMANPNYQKEKVVAYPGLAKPQFIYANEWTDVPKTDVPLETFWYAVDDRPQVDHVVLQIHKWVDETITDPNNDVKVPVADWVVWDKAPAYRGDYIGKVERVQVPIWFVEKERYELARDNKRRNLPDTSARIPVDFTVTQAGANSPAILVDWSGGKQSLTRIGREQAKEDVALQLLVMNPDGKLVLRNTSAETENEERTGRADANKKWLAQVKNQMRSAIMQRQMPTLPGAGGAGGGTAEGK